MFSIKGEEGKTALDQWLIWARRSQLPAFVHLAKRVTKHREAIDANLDHGLSQGLIESTNTKIRLLTRIAFGFHGPGSSTGTTTGSGNDRTGEIIPVGVLAIRAIRPGTALRVKPIA